PLTAASEASTACIGPLRIVFESFFFFQAEDGIRDFHVTGVQTCALPILGVLYFMLLHDPRDGLEKHEVEDAHDHQHVEGLENQRPKVKSHRIGRPSLGCGEYHVDEHPPSPLPTREK